MASQQPPDDEAGKGQAPPNVPPPMVPPPGPGGMYSYPPSYGFPPQPMMPPMGPGPMMMPPQPYGMPGMAPPPENKKPVGKQVCTVHPQGMPRAFDVPFAERRLPVCDRCKKNFKSRELCRRRDGHKALPWQVTYVVVTLTDEVLEKAQDGALTYTDVGVVAELQDTPLMCLGPADGSMESEPICKVCREKNYTRDYCRKTCKHTTPPWSTTYVKLVVDKTPKDEAKFKYSKKRKKTQEENAHGKPFANGEEQLEPDQSDDLSQIHQSKTFLAVISSRKMVIRWCERIQYPAVSELEEPSSDNPLQPPSAPSNTPSMQYQLWDAFRAGAMWAQSQGGQVPPGYGYGAMPNPTHGSPMPFFGQAPGGPMGYPPSAQQPPANSNARGSPGKDNSNGGEGGGVKGEV